MKKTPRKVKDSGSLGDKISAIIRRTAAKFNTPMGKKTEGSWRGYVVILDIR